MARIGRALWRLVLAAIGVFLWPVAAQADCKGRWDLSGHWEITQSNGVPLKMDLTQSGKDIGGSASYADRSEGIMFGVLRSGPVTGTIDINGNILIRMDWGSEYRGGVGSDAVPGGDIRNAGVSAGVSWRGNRQAICMEVTTTTPPSQAEPPGKLENFGVEKQRKGATEFQKRVVGPAPDPCTVLKDSDMFVTPGGAKIAGLILRAGTPEVNRLGMMGANWFHLKWPAGQGWAFSGPGYPDAIRCP